MKELLEDLMMEQNEIFSNIPPAKVQIESKCEGCGRSALLHRDKEQKGNIIMKFKKSTGEFVDIRDADEFLINLQKHVGFRIPDASDILYAYIDDDMNLVLVSDKYYVIAYSTYMNLILS